jgi:signal transduction histidine kinase
MPRNAHLGRPAMSWRPLSSSAANVSFEPPPSPQWIELLLILRSRWRIRLLVIACGLVPLIFALDWWLPPAISLFAFYSVPLLLIVVTSRGWWPPYLLAALAAFLAQLAVWQDTTQGSVVGGSFSVPAFFMWGIASRFVTYALEVALTRGLLDMTLRLRGLERRAHDALQALLEMAEALVLTPADGVGADLSAPDTAADTPPAVRRLAELAQSVLRCRGVSIDAIDQDTLLLRPVAVVGRDLAPEGDHAWRRRVAYSLQPNQPGLLSALTTRLHAGQVVTLGKSDLQDNGRLGLGGSSRVVLAPMCIDGQLIGLVIVDDGERTHEPLPDELALLGAVAQLAAVVVERERLLQAQATAIRLTELDRLRTDFIATVSHDLQTPITSIRAGLDLLETAIGEVLAPDERDLLAAVRRNVARLRVRVNALLTANQLDAGALHLDHARLDLRSATMGAVRTVQPLFLEKRQALSIDLPEPLPVVGDGHRLEEVIVNLLANAHHHTPAGTRVMVAGAVGAEGVHLRVDDSGPGVPAEDLDLIFARFHRRGAGGGSGLGLSIARSVVQLHGGRLWAESPHGVGTTFHLTLPRDGARNQP